MTELQYHLIVQNGDTQKEIGHFFKAAPFELEANGNKITVEFKMGKDHRVVYHIHKNGQPALELEHPDYTLSDVAPENLGEWTPLFAALSRLEITKSKTYRTYFEDAGKVQTYDIRQKPFLTI